MSDLPRRLAALFLLALLGILTMFGAILGRLAGVGAVAVYAALVLVALVLAARVARSRARAARIAAGRTCSCCTSSVHEPVTVI